MNLAGRTLPCFVLCFIGFFAMTGVLWAAYPGDLNGNGTVEWGDLATMALSWLVDNCGSIPQGNLDSDCDVDFKDYAVLANDWFRTTPKNIVYHVTNLNDSGADSFADCLTRAETDGKDSVILFDVGGREIREHLKLTRRRQKAMAGESRDSHLPVSRKHNVLE